MGRAIRIGALGVTAVMVLAAALWLVLFAGEAKRVTVYFAGTVGLYPDSDVRMLGVPVGTVDAVEPDGDRVKVSLSLDSDVAVPADAYALIVTPSLVSDRYVQLAPVYRGGPRLVDGAVIDLDRTMVPVEIDELFASLNDLTTALGPNGANRDGALSKVLGSAARTMRGNGKPYGEMIRELGKAAQTLGGSDEDLFGTIDGLQKFTTMLAENDTAVREFDELLASVSSVFADERDELSGAMRELAGALAVVAEFVRENRGLVKSNVDQMLGTTEVMARQRASLAEALREAPQALEDLLDAYDPRTSTIDARADLNEFGMSYDPNAGGPPLPLPSSGGDR